MSGNPESREPALRSYYDDSSQRSDDDPSSNFSSDQLSNSQNSNRNLHLASFLSFRKRNQDDDSTCVSCPKVLMLLILFLAAMGCAAATYWIASHAERQAGEVLFHDTARELVDVSNANARTVLAAVMAMATATTSHALDRSVEFPLLSLPHYIERASQVSELSGTALVALCPLVNESQVPKWNEYSVRQAPEWVPAEVLANAQISPKIAFRNATDLPPPFLPVWQMTPVITTVINLDVRAFPNARVGLESVLETGDAALTPIDNLGPDRDIFDFPHSSVVVPVYDSFDSKSKRIRALYFAVQGWHTWFEGILKDASVELVISNPCQGGQAVTYSVEGPNVTLTSREDLHNSKFDRLRIRDSFWMEDATCPFTMEVYPTKTLLNSKDTVRPLLYTFFVIGIFAITSTAFCIYDFVLRNQQSKIVSKAERSHAIVSSLFPEQVHSRLLAGRENGEEDGVSPHPDHPASPGGKKKRKEEYRASDLLSTKPIADLFPDSTVLFADISGFTAWSSVREPTQVFMLLEQVYNSFDTVAKKRRIFKVETIGDCYVAAAGLPEPRKDHAEAMCRFAHECRSKMNQVAKKLEVILGPDTSELAMRFGVHSGPVTAGVLRGEKSRFQLFGDTVNTASRIESTGERNRIHLSQETANLLSAAGKSRWIKPREGKISAKGKGTIQTYWLTLRSAKIADDSHKDANDGATVGGNSLEASILSAASPCDDGSSSNDTAAASIADVVTETSGTKGGSAGDARLQRLIEWNVDVLARHLKKIVAMRSSSSTPKAHSLSLSGKPALVRDLRAERKIGENVLDEVVEIIPLSSKSSDYKQDPSSVELPKKAVSQLHDLVTTIAAMYHDNAFHSFDHASHVTQSVTKLLARVVTSDDIDYKDMQYKKKSKQHDYTFGITSDPLLQFACAFSALVHDVDHTGLPNSQLVKEQTDLAKLYHNKSVAEQNSVDIAWDLLMEPTYDDLRECIYSSQEELDRFRCVVVNSVMATDIVDKELGALRKKRWATAFDNTRSGSIGNGINEIMNGSTSISGAGSSTCSLSDQGENSSEDPGKVHKLKKSKTKQEDICRKATIVIEHLIQASDVSHTMQHWHVYVKWNEKLFREMYKAYKTGRADVDPSIGWFEGELGFFDFYIIPLAKKLQECGVFGVASDEYLNYAEANRREWELKGHDAVAGYLERYHHD